MSKFVIECPNCGKYAEAATGFFARKKVDCSCGYTIRVSTDKMTSRTCPHCGNTVVFDQSKGERAKCPVCKNPINTMAEQSKMQEFTCGQCGVRHRVAVGTASFVCPVCDFENDVQQRVMQDKIRHEGMASVIKYEGEADALIWKHPVEDFNMGSQLIVHESQQAIFFRDGQALDLFGPGRYTLETQQLPILEKLYQLPTDSEQTFHSEVYFVNLTTQMAMKWGTAEKINLIDPLSDAPMAIGARGMLNLRVSDPRRMLLKLVGTTQGLSRQDILDGNAGSGNIRNYFKSVLQMAVSTNLANAIREENIDILQIDQQKMTLSARMLKLIAPYFADYGMAVTEFLLEGIVLPQKGELGYDSLQTIIEMHKRRLAEASIETKLAIQKAEAEAAKQLEIQKQENQAAIIAAQKGVIAAQGEADILRAQMEGQRAVAQATGETAAERLRMQLEMDRKLQTAQIEAEEMRLKGYTQKDVLQAGVMTAFAEHPGEGGGAAGMTGLAGDAMRMGMGFAAMGATVGMASDMMGAGLQNGRDMLNAQPSGWDCVCGQRGISTNFCPNCGSKRPAAPAGWTCPSCGKADIATNFCPECGTPKPAGPAVWTCPNCGNAGITGKFCPECGTKKEG